MSGQSQMMMTLAADDRRHSRLVAQARRGLLLLVNVAMIILAARLTWLSLHAGAAGCGAAGGCDEVLASAWARWLNIPVSALALAIYGVTLPTLLLWIFGSSSRLSHAAGVVLTCSGVVIIGAAVWFTGLMMWRLEQTCTRCLTLHSLGLVFVALLVPELTITSRRRWGSSLAWGAVRGPVLIGGLTILGLAGGQIFRPSSTAHVQAVESSAPAAPPVSSLDKAVVAGRVYDSGPGPDRVIQSPLIDRTLRFADFPRIGPADAPHVLILFGDYACPHCHELSDQLMQAVDRYPGQLAVLHVMSPLNPACNPGVAGRPADPRFAASCDLARLALAVNLIDPAAFERFERWAARSPTTLVLPEALDEAIRLVGREELIKRLAGPDVEAALARHLDVFQALPPEQSTLPLLVAANHYITGAPPRPAELFAILEKNLGLQPPQP